MDAPESDERWVRIRRTEISGGDWHEVHDTVVREEPLELRIGQSPVAVVMRTPGHDEELARGFLVSERIVRRGEDVASVRHCDRIEDPEAEDNVIRITLAPHVSVDLGRLRRNLYASSSCGICGRASIDDLLDGLEPIASDVRIDASMLSGLPDRLRGAQDVFEITGGLHAAGLFEPDGRVLVVREDIGRHNAVDKVIGWASMNGASSAAVMMVSGRVSFEIVQKALAARIPAIAAVSAPSSLAVELARRSGVTLVGFLRGSRMCVYANGQRLRAASST